VEVGRGGEQGEAGKGQGGGGEAGGLGKAGDDGREEKGGIGEWRGKSQAGTIRYVSSHSANRASLASQSANRADLSISASPAPTSASEYARPSSRLGTPAEIPASDRTNLKQKKRKLAHLAGGSPEEADTASVSSYRGRAGSSTREGSVSAGVERISAVPVTGAFVGSTGGTPGADRAASVSQAVPSGLKVKLSLSNSGKVGTDNGSRYLLLIWSCRTVRPCLQRIRYHSPDP
jgi:hypothetical protein